MPKARNDPEAGVPPKLSSKSPSGRINVIATEDLLRELDDWRREHPDLPTKSEAVRLILTEALADWRAAKTGGPRKV